MANRIGYQNYYSGRPRNPQFDTIETPVPVIADVPVGGITGQVLAKNSNTDMDLKWVTPEVPEVVEIPAEEESFEMFVAGELAVGTDKYGFTAPFDMTIKEIQVAVATAPTGASAIFDINNNGTTIYTTQDNRPTLIAEADSVTAVLPDEVEVVKGDLITLDIDQVGSTETGETLMVTILCEVTRAPA